MLMDISFDVEKEIKKIAKKHGFLEFYLTSAKTGKHIQDSFNSIINILVKNALKEKQELMAGIQSQFEKNILMNNFAIMQNACCLRKNLVFNE